MVKIDELKKEKLQALKEKNTNKSNLLSVIISNFQLVEIEKKAKGENVSEETMLSVLNKVLKGLNDEKEMFASNNKEKEAKTIEEQISIVKAYLPKLLDEEEVRKIISSLSDKSVKSIMTKFKTEYAGKVDFGLVAKVAKEFN